MTRETLLSAFLLFLMAGSFALGYMWGRLKK